MATLSTLGDSDPSDLHKTCDIKLFLNKELHFPYHTLGEFWRECFCVNIVVVFFIHFVIESVCV